MMQQRLRGFVRRRPTVTDALLAALIAGVVTGAVLTGPGPHQDPRPLDWFDAVAEVVAAAVLTLRRRRPLWALCAAALGAACTLALHVPNPMMLIAVLVMLVTVGAVTDRRTAWLAAGGTAVVLLIGTLLSGGSLWAHPELLGMTAWAGTAVAVGDAIRSRRAFVAAIQERARQAEQSREEEARRQVVEERLRIARELHDVVAHHIALINVQAGVAAHVLRQSPDQAEEALAHVRKAARTVLEETSTLLGVLRRPGDPVEDSEPVRGLGRLHSLLDALAAAGFKVESRRDGPLLELPSAVDLAAFRIVQESLTNAQKHSLGDSARLIITYRPDGLGIDVSNPAGESRASDGGGHGLIGMRERATAVGGTLTTAYRDGRFVLTADLPLEARV